MVWADGEENKVERVSKVYTLKLLGWRKMLGATLRGDNLSPALCVYYGSLKYVREFIHQNVNSPSVGSDYRAELSHTVILKMDRVLQ